jgi:hypothetical protein
LLNKTAVGVATYAVLAFALDAAGVRSRCRHLVRVLHKAAA